jgi:hypothetical protein
MFRKTSSGRGIYGFREIISNKLHLKTFRISYDIWGEDRLRAAESSKRKRLFRRIHLIEETHIGDFILLPKLITGQRLILLQVSPG